jgi:hypothetical protein
MPGGFPLAREARHFDVRHLRSALGDADLPMSKPERLNRFGVSMEESLLREFDSLCANRGYGNRLEATRDLIRNVLVENKLQDENAQSVGTLTLV